MEPIITKLDDNIADICSLPRGQLFRIRKALYGLPSSGRLWYEHYTTRLKREGYTQSIFDPCLFTRINESEITYTCLFVDDTYVFSNKADYMDDFVFRMRQYYQVTLDTKGVAYSSLGKPTVPLFSRNRNSFKSSSKNTLISVANIRKSTRTAPHPLETLPLRSFRH